MDGIWSHKCQDPNPIIERTNKGLLAHSCSIHRFVESDLRLSIIPWFFSKNLPISRTIRAAEQAVASGEAREGIHLHLRLISSPKSSNSGPFSPAPPVTILPPPVSSRSRHIPLPFYFFLLFLWFLSFLQCARVGPSAAPLGVVII